VKTEKNPREVHNMGKVGPRGTHISRRKTQKQGGKKRMRGRKECRVPLYTRGGIL